MQWRETDDLSFPIGKLKTFGRKTQIQMLPPATLPSVRFSLELLETNYRVTLRYRNKTWYKLFVVVAALVILLSLDRMSGLWGDQYGAPTSLLWMCNPRHEGEINFEFCIFGIINTIPPTTLTIFFTRFLTKYVVCICVSNTTVDIFKIFCEYKPFTSFFPSIPDLRNTLYDGVLISP